MSDVTSAPEPSDEQALAEIDLTEFGITTDFTDDNLTLLFDTANSSLDVVLAAVKAAQDAAKSETATDPKSVARKRVNDVPASDELSATVSSVLETLFSVIDQDSAQAAPALTMLGGIVKFVSDVRDVEISRVTAEVKTEQGISADAPDADDDVAFHTNVFKACRGVLTKLISVCGIMKKPVPASIPTEKNSNGDLVPTLRSLPKGRRPAGSANLGRGSKARRVRYTWTPKDGETESLRDGILLAEIAVTVISSGSYRVLSDELQAMFGKDGVDQFSETPWILEFETGTLSGHLPKAE